MSAPPAGRVLSPDRRTQTNLFLYAPPHRPTACAGCKKESIFDVYAPPPADRRYPGLDAAMRAVSEVGDAVRDQGVPPDFGPLVIAITGNGNASRGAQARRRALFFLSFFFFCLRCSSFLFVFFYAFRAWPAAGGAFPRGRFNARLSSCLRWIFSG